MRWKGGGSEFLPTHSQTVECSTEISRRRDEDYFERSEMPQKQTRDRSKEDRRGEAKKEREIMKLTEAKTDRHCERRTERDRETALDRFALAVRP